MKRLIYLLLLFASSCSSTITNKELYSLTDSYVESLQTTYERYGLFGSKEHIKTTSDGQYQVMPLGRLINVKILKVVNEETYKDLQEDLADHYREDKRVNKVYISNAGTIMIDCRN